MGRTQKVDLNGYFSDKVENILLSLIQGSLRLLFAIFINDLQFASKFKIIFVDDKSFASKKKYRKELFNTFNTELKK